MSQEHDGHDEEVEAFVEDRNRDRSQAEAIQRAITILREHFDAVQIVATTTTDEDKTELAVGGYGNYFARIEATRRCLMGMNGDE